MGSSPTPGAILADSTNSLKYQNRENNNVHLRDACGSAISLTTGQTVKDELKDKILLICKNQKHYVQKLLNDLLEKSKENVLIFSDSSLIFLKDRAKSMRVGIGMISRGEVALIVAGVG